MKIFESFNGAGFPNFLIVMTEICEDGDNSFITTISQNTSLKDTAPSERTMVIGTNKLSLIGNFEGVVIESLKLDIRKQLVEHCEKLGMHEINLKFEELSSEKIIALRMYGAFDFLLPFKSSFHHAHLQTIISNLTKHPPIY